ncbi:cytochrome P450 4C1-like isoform X1 [Neodiprion fabricii]|uniref:cytochrome P450 4C1-like isoform X1 n=1 Tax=Neodiprion fabricii TaxID=2872261 RepID=UPI001ED8C70C|nr:cytochrome P450 4C1-like isoform X1 [Neodiprion fabricii]
MERLTLVTQSVVIACLIFYAVSKIIVNLAKRRSFGNRCSRFEGPPRLPIIGNAYLFIGSAEAIMNKFLELDKLYPRYYQLSLGTRSIFVTSVPEQLKVIFNSSKTIDRGGLLDFARPWLGSGILLAKAAKWQVHRKLIQPTFSPMILKSFIEVFSRQSAMMVRQMERHVNGDEFEVQKYLSPYTLNMICGTTMGVKLEAQTDENCQYAEAVEKTTSSICTRALRPWLHPSFIFYRTQLGKEQQKEIQIMHDFVENVIRTKKELLQNRPCQPEINTNEYDEPKIGGEVFLDHLLNLPRDKKTLTDDEIRDEVHSIVLPASDAPAITVSFVMLMLASHPDLQDKVYEELREIYGDDDNEDQLVTPDDLSRMNYLEQVIKETMRLFPGSPFLIREVTDDLDIGDRVLPKGSSVAPNILRLHRSEEYWSDPFKFDPDRFLPENITEQYPHSYLPFGAGPRSCLGKPNSDVEDDLELLHGLSLRIEVDRIEVCHDDDENVRGDDSSTICFDERSSCTCRTYPTENGNGAETSGTDHIEN